jgi:GNAT superfamily N-acetyltransferase
MSLAATEHLDGIAAVLDEVWGEKFLYSVAQRYIEDPRRALWVGTDVDGAVGGFVSAFAAETVSGCNWTVDILAVRPSFQGRGFGRALAQAALSSAAELGLVQSRALVRVENAASQRCFAAAGYDGDPVVREMLLWQPGKMAVEGESDLHLLPVDALTYRGLWLDGLEGVGHAVQRRAIAAALALCTRENRDNISALVPVDRLAVLASDLRVAAQMHGAYQWWQRAVSASDGGDWF